MAIPIQGNAGVVVEVEANSRALRSTPRPIDHGALGQYRLSMISGTIAAALGASSEVFQFRWTDATRLCLVQKVVISGGANVAATAAALVSMDVLFARAFTAAGTGGATASLAGNNQKLRTSMGTSLLGEARMITTAALGVGTKTLDNLGLGNYAIGIGTGAITAASRLQLFDRIPLFDSDGGESHGIVLAQNEGFVIRNGPVAFPAAMTWNLGVVVTWAELTAY